MQPLQPGLDVGAVDVGNGDMTGVKPDVKLSEVGLITSYSGATMSGFQQLEKPRRMRRQRKIRTRPRTARIETEEITSVKPVEIFQGESVAPSTDPVAFCDFRKTLQEPLDFRDIELPDRSKGRL